MKKCIEIKLNYYFFDDNDKYVNIASNLHVLESSTYHLYVYRNFKLKIKTTSLSKYL